MLCSHSSFTLHQLLLKLLFSFLLHYYSPSPILVFGSTITTTMHPLEQETLFKIMETLSSDQDWRSSYPNPCRPGASSWPGIVCKFTANDIRYSHVTRLDFGTPPNPSCKNSATFPPEIFELPHLESIFIFQCFTRTPTRITFPPQNRALPTPSPLQQLSLRSNSALIGTIPPQLLSSLTSLQILTLSQNRLSGKIPTATIPAGSSLVHLDLSYNVLTGPIPSEIGSLRKLVGLDLSYNRLTGKIPSSIGELAVLQKLDLSSNSLAGAIPDAVFNRLESLVFLALSNNRLNINGAGFGGRKKKIGLRNLQYFLMDGNLMFAPLPVEFGQLKKLQELRLSNSGYWGKIPPEYSQLVNLSSLSLQNNRLSGEIPAGFAGLSRIYHMNLSRNLLDGVVPFNSSFLRRLGRNLDLSGNAGLCLTPSAAADDGGGGVGVGVCGKTKTGSPLKLSEAPLLGWCCCSNYNLLFTLILMLFWFF
ncbi:hypothetical protein ACP275_13G046100 [Erythranthe tilingii]